MPLRLADGLAGRLDRCKSAPSLTGRLLFFFRLTRRGGPGRSRGAVLPTFGLLLRQRRLPAASFGGVRDERFGGGAGFGVSRRVTIPWPTVQRFVVIQYMSRPTGNRVITGTKKTGSDHEQDSWLRWAVGGRPKSA